MRGVDILASFELETKKLDETLDKPVTDDSLYWINQAVVKFVKDRFNGNAPKRTSYEQNEKRTRDLVHLLSNSVYQRRGDELYLNDKYVQWLQVYDEEGESETENDYRYNIKLDVTHPSYDSYEYTYPEDLMFVLNEDVIISDVNDGHVMDTSVFECTADNFMYRINNKLTDFHYRFHRARPLRVRTRDGFKLLTDKKYKIKAYTLGYLKVPTEITSEDPYKDYTDFDDHIWLEITKIAAQMFIENQSDPRYKTIVNEVLTQE